MNEQTANFFQKNGVQLGVQVVGVVVLVLNLWLATKLGPLAQNIDLVATRVSALELKMPMSDIDHTDIQVIKEQVMQIRNDLKDIKEVLQFLRNK